jgi:hypothetical protein
MRCVLCNLRISISGGKAAILATLIDESMRDRVVGDTLAGIRESATPTDVIRISAHGVRVDNERYHDIIQVMKTAAVIDDSVTDILIRSDRGYRDSLAQTAVRLREMDALPSHLADAQAVDILWFYLGHEAWHVLVSERHWSWDDAEGWLGDQVASALLKSSPA